LWLPTPEELRGANISTGMAPAEIVAIDDGQSRNLRDVTNRLAAAPDRAVVQLAMALTDLLDKLQAVNPESCWAFAHDGAAELNSLLPPGVLEPVAAAERQVADAPPAPQPRIPIAELMKTLRARGAAQGLDGLRPGADHAAFCPSLRRLLLAVLALPDPSRAGGLRAVLAGG
jgi:hypothetical protein